VGAVAGEDAAVITVRLPWRIVRCFDKFPAGLVPATPLLIPMFVLEVALHSIEVNTSSPAHGVIVTDSLFPEVDDDEAPVHVTDVDWGE